jgi:hypothetical protein
VATAPDKIDAAPANTPPKFHQIYQFFNPVKIYAALAIYLKVLPKISYNKRCPFYWKA